MLKIEIMSGLDSLQIPGYYIAIIDGLKSKNIKTFLDEISRAFQFPDYFGYNYNALDECLNDLEWIRENHYALYIMNYDQFFADESHEERIHALQVLNNAANEWANVPNFDGEEEFRKKADFKIILEKTDKAIQDLKHALVSNWS